MTSFYMCLYTSKLTLFNVLINKNKKVDKILRSHPVSPKSTNQVNARTVDGTDFGK